MKWFILILPLLLHCCIILAQDFAPIGATWHYEKRWAFSSQDRSYFKIESIQDTTIQGKNCRMLNSSEHPSCVHPSLINYVYQEDSIVYFYNGVLGNFQILYNLKAKKDNSWVTIFFCAPNMDTLTVMVDTSYSMNINGNNLMVLKVRYIPPSNSVNNYIYPGTIIERIGDTHFLFNLQDYNSFCDDTYSGGIRCYQDSVLGLYSTNIALDCDFTYVGIEEINLLNFIRTSPNPARSLLYIELTEQFLHLQSVQLFSIAGQLLTEQFLPLTQEATINVQHLPSGFYFCRVLFSNGESVVRKVVVE